MRKWKWLAWFFGVGLFFIERGLDVSGVVNMPLAIGLWITGGVLILAGITLQFLPFLRRVIGLNGANILVVSKAELYQVGDGSHWLRLQVENKSANRTQDCYGKLLDRRHLSFKYGLNDEITHLMSDEKGSESHQHGEFPPEGHRFPWSPTDRSLIKTSIATDSHEYLYLVRKHEQSGRFLFPANAGNEPENWGLGDFQLDLEIGSESQDIRPSKVRVVFRAEGADLELVNWNVLD